MKSSIFLTAFLLIFSACSVHRSSSAIVEDIESRLYQSPPIARSAHDIRFEVSGSSVIVYGDVQSAAIEQQVLDLVEGVPGVRSVKNELEVRPSSETAKKAMVRAILQRITKEPDLQNHKTRIVLKDGVLQLEGSVPNLYVKNRIEQIALEETRGARVESALRIGSSVPDDNILAAIQAAVDNDFFTFDVQNGVVTVRGNASDFQTVDATIAKVLNTEGVLDVKSDVRVRGQEYLSQTTHQGTP